MKKRRYIYSMLAALCIAAILLPQQAAQAAGEPKQAEGTKIVLDGYPLEFAAKPTIIQGTTMVPFRGIAEALGIEVTWDPKTKTVAAKQATADGEKSVLLKLNQKTAKTVSIQSPPKKMYSMTYYAIASFKERHLLTKFDAAAFGWARLQEDSTITTSGKDFYWPEPAGEITPESIVDGAKQDGTSPYLMIFASDRKNELTNLLEDEALAAKAREDIIELAQEKGFSGIALDFEGLGLSGDIAKAKQDYNRFVAQLAKQAEAADLKLTLVLHPLNGAYQGYDYKTLASEADDIIIMAYAYEDEKAPEPLHKVDEAIQLALKEVPRDKLILGLSMGSENSKSVSSVIGLAKRHNLKGTAIWRLGLIGEDAMAQVEKSIVPLKQ
ncbi:glycosyl hydrolase [Paenibacillus dendritiformis]|uniref:stalk domain-containing protein n=1 Tax=Paenibacillus dendritiformis TaxID=130049 RepID=UPI0018CE2D20|nr:glycosyl hydrolase family 18 protein [Paenibacillus dendritiformis]MBG9793384.1 glycosyl hydrolase [Paenibacillus dendritiformis]